MPNKGRNFNTQKFGKMYLFVICMISRHWFQTNYFYILPNFGDFGAKMSFFHYIINQKRNNFIKHYPPPPVYQEAADIRDVYLYKKFAVQVGSLYTGERCSIDKKQRGVGLQHTQYIIANGKLRQSSNFRLKHEFWHYGSS